MVACSANPEVLENDEKESQTAWIGVGSAHIYSDEATNTMRHGAFVVYLVHIMLLQFSVRLEHSLLDDGYELVKLLVHQEERGGGSAEDPEKMLVGEMGIVV